MVACIIDTERGTVFHIDADHRWVKKEFAAFKEANAARYRMFKILRPDCKLIAAAAGGKLIVAYRGLNLYVPPERRAPQSRLDILERAHLIVRDGDGYRLTRYGESVAALVQSPDPEIVE